MAEQMKDHPETDHNTQTVTSVLIYVTLMAIKFTWYTEAIYKQNIENINNGFR